jgi:hypothetical protein
MRSRLLLALALGCGLGSLSGCQGKSDALPPEPVLHPVWGKVTAQGKPLAHAVITFLPVDTLQGTMTVGETDEGGDYALSYLGRPGTAAAEYKVAISYLVGTDGTVYGLGPRSGLAKPYGLLSAKELIPPEWSDLGRTTQRATVPINGSVINFDIQEPLLPPPAPEEAPAAGEASKDAVKAVDPVPAGGSDSEPSPAEPSKAQAP